MLLLTVCPSTRLPAQTLPNNSGALFLTLPVGAEAIGMGQTAVTLQGRGEAAFWNPAGLATMAESEFALETGTPAAGPTYALTAYFHAHGIGVIGGALYMLNYGDLDRTDSTSSTIARISPRNYEFLASYAAQLGGAVSLGINYKLIEFRVDCSGDCRQFPNGDGVTHGLDIGGQVTVGGADGALRVGFAIRNIGFKLQVNNRDQADELPAQVVLGAQYRIPLPGSSGQEVAGGDGEGSNVVDRLDVKVAADVQSPWGSYGDSEMRIGVDVGYQRLVRLRGGYAFVRDGLSGPSVGMGVSSGTIGVDFARSFLTGSDFVSENPTFFSFHVTF
ncbi:MAG TPA: PorV/PorQ family protein [Gemmatimonadales bacterium]|nr:PorV/PorQ family protein [Gemmatimonadales bacterium]